MGVGTATPSELLHVYTTTIGEGGRFGISQIGNNISDATLATFSHSDIYDEAESYALTQTSAGKTTINSKLGQDICFSHDDVEKMVLQSGFLGIGITNPSDALSVVGNTRLDGDVVITGVLEFEGPFVESLVFQDNLLKLAADNTSNELDIGIYGTYVETGDTKYSGVFWDASNAAWRIFDSLEVDPGVTVDTSATGYNDSKFIAGSAYIIGDVGIGVTVPSYPLDVNGIIRCEQLITTSDERAKNILGFLSEEESYNKIKQTEIYKYQLLSDNTEKERNGFIAQQLEKIMPEATVISSKIINGIEIEDFRGIDQNTILANLTNALKFSIKKIEKLEEEILNLKNTT